MRRGNSMPTLCAVRGGVVKYGLRSAADHRKPLDAGTVTRNVLRYGIARPFWNAGV
jgi:hypothetical protein